MFSRKSKGGGNLNKIRSHTEDDQINIVDNPSDNPITDKRTTLLRSGSGDQHGAISDSMCIESDESVSDSREDDSAQTGPQVVKQQWRPHTGRRASAEIYQGLAMTDTDKLNQGMMPDSVFMIARLEQQEQIEMLNFGFSSHVPVCSPFQPPLPINEEEGKGI